MNIDVRNIDSDWIDAIEYIKTNVEGVNNNAKAVRFASLQYSSLIDIVDNLEKKVARLTDLLDEAEEDKEDVRNYFVLQKKIIKNLT